MNSPGLAVISRRWRLLFVVTSLLTFFSTIQHASAALTIDPTVELAVRVTNQNAIVSWTGANSVPYQLESSSNLISWSNVGSLLTGTGASLSVTNPISGSRRFFRVKRVFPAADNSAVFNPASGLLTIVGDDQDNIITVSRSGDIILVNNGAIPITGGLATATNTVLIQVLGKAGNDQLTISTTGGVMPPGHLFGDTGNDTLNGGTMNDLLVGGAGDDILNGRQGNDQLFGGDGDDTFVWNPGDGSDLIEGGDGVDTLLFNGANVNENIGISANGFRVLFTRDVASIMMDLNGVEVVHYNAFGGTDTINVNPLTDTDVAQVIIDLAAIPGTSTGDSQTDTVNINGTSGSDTFNFSADNGAVVATSFGAEVRVIGGEINFDHFVVNGVGSDLVNINGSTNADTMTVTANGVYARANATGFTIPVDVTGSLALSVDGLEGDDNISCSGSLAVLNIPLRLDGGPGNDIIFGSNGPDTIFGGPGNDSINGSQGNDLIFMGDDNDTFNWNPGDGSDIVEGQSGFDTMVFNGANINENISLSANGARLLFTRDVANIALDVDGVERVNFTALGGTDNVTVNPLAGTAVTQVNISLASVIGTTNGDSAADTVTINGTAGADTFNFAADAGAVVATGTGAEIRVTAGEISLDHIVVNGVGSDLVNINGSTNADIMTVTGNGIYARANATGFTIPVDVTGSLALSVNGLEGDDNISCSGSLAALNIPLRLDGGPGNDIIFGSNGPDTIFGGPGDDSINGGQGNDVIFMGDDNDTFNWNPGDASDIVEGQTGFDTMVFNGANINENISLSANGARLLFTRDVANIALDVDGVERVNFNALGGADHVTVNNLSGTSVTNVNLNLAANGGGGDSAADVIIVNGTAAADAITVAVNSGGVDVTGLPAVVRITGSEAAFDSLVVNGLGGVDTFTVGGNVSTLINVTTNQ
jgi:Ca2+-binding RTX toxin-like protein